MAVRVGIPRALLYYNYYPMWKVFFEELGAEVVLSDLTNKSILDDGVTRCVDDACLPIKLFHGHVINLKDRVDFIFVPRLISLEKNEYICPKFCGLPDMVVNSIKGLPRIIEVTVNLRNNNSTLRKAVIQIGKLFTGDYTRIYSAYKKAVKRQKEFESKMEEGFTPVEIIEGKEHICRNGRLTVGLIGHPYNIYDEYANMKIIEKLRVKEISVITQDMISNTVINDIASNFPKPMFWSFGKKVMATAQYLADRKMVDGIIYLVAFGCGLDSLVGDLVERKARKKGMPFCLLTIDEHTGEAGIDTRLEAFLDMLEWRRNRA